MIECSSCGRAQEPRLICVECGSPLSASLDYFSALGLPKNPVLELPALERRYHDLSRQIHPDRFATAAASVRDSSLRATALLTRAYRTLRDPVSRGLYWLELSGEKLGENNQRVPADLAETVFEVQEQLAELRDSPAPLELAARVTGKRAELQSAMDASLVELETNFSRWNHEQRPEPKMLRLELKAILSKLAYLRTLIRDVDRALENAKAA